VPGATSCGVTELDEVEDVDVPPALVAVTANVYAVPFVNPVIVQLPEEPVTVQVFESGVEVTV
jgi:hypothetical protein